MSESLSDSQNRYDSDDEVLLRVQGVSKKFCRSLKKSLWYGVLDIASELMPINRSSKTETQEPNELRPDEFWAVRDISFELRRGECLGLIGRNGAGKTTLLKMLNGLIKPDTGRIEMRGRIGAIIALGAGFNPILTGRENIYVNASVLGLTKTEIDKKIDEIIDFAEISDFIDSPVQSYSSGMQVRLGFAVATVLNPDILILDEVLAVGDAAFRHKCYHRIQQMKTRAAVVLVSHNMEQIGNTATAALVLNRGRLEFKGSVSAAAECYEALNADVHNAEPSTKIKSSAPILVVEPSISHSLSNGSELQFEALLETSESIENSFLRIKILASNETTVAEIDTRRNPIRIPCGRSKIRLASEKLFLKPGIYSARVAMHQIPNPAPIFIVEYQSGLVIEGPACTRIVHHQIPARLINCHS